MKNLTEFFGGLFATDKWPPRWKCGYWSDFHGWMYIISDLMIWLAYFLIPIIIINYFTRKRNKIRFHGVYLLFASFILLCGTTHFLDALMFWEPAYRFNALVRFVTGVVSLLTVYHLVQVLPLVSKARTSLELETEIERRQKIERELEEANIRLSAFASIASHDLQEPVRKILTYTSVINTMHRESFDEKSRLNLDKIKHSATRMQSLIRDILALSTVDTEKKHEVIDPSAAVKMALDNLELHIQDKKVVVEVESLPPVKGDVSSLSQVFTNLIGNSIKFNEKQPHIRVTGKETDEHAVIEVHDNGIGIDPEYYSKIFEAFQRLHAKSSKYEGTGMGLAICKRVMDVHGGDITVQSQPGTGSTFILKFPKVTRAGN